MILSEQQVENGRNLEGEAYLKTKLGFGILDIFKLGEADAGGSIKGAGSKKVLETFEIKTTKSVILDEVIKKCKSDIDFSQISEGELIKVDNVRLSLENEDELRVVKLINSGALKNMVTPGTNGIELNGIFNSMFKDYAYKIKGEVGNNNLLVKIPLTFESEFESSYSVDDLFVGRVSIIGLYKGKIKVDDLKNSFQYFQELGQLQNAFSKNNDVTDEIQDSHYEIKQNQTFAFRSSGDTNDYHYVDLLAVVQNVNIK